MNIAAVLLAAGAATRMGRTKQLLPYRGRTLIEHAVEQAMAAGFASIVVVLGANAEQVRKALAHLPVTFAFNEAWQSGMGSSIAAGMATLPEVEAVAILLADQPCVLGSHLRTMRQAFETGNTPVLASYYNGQPGVPAIFAHGMFPRLCQLPLEAGARHLLRDAGVEIGLYPLAEAAIDIDTPEDYQRES